MDVLPEEQHGYPVLVLTLTLFGMRWDDIHCRSTTLVDLYENGQLTSMLTWACVRLTPADARHGLERLPWSYPHDEVHLPDT